MVTGIRLGNFKAFSSTQSVPIRPLTLIFGPNSAGKSSLVHSLALAHEASRTRNLDITQTKIGGASVDLGGFAQYVHGRQDNRRVQWGIEFDVPGTAAHIAAEVRRLFVGMTIGLQLDTEGRPQPGASAKLISYEVEADGALLLRMSRRRDDRLQIDRLEYAHPLAQRLLKSTEPFKGKTLAELEKPVTDALAGITSKSVGLFPAQFTHSETHPGAHGPPIRAAVDKIVGAANSLVRKELKNLRYLGPLRSYPPRHLALTEHEDTNWIAGGGYAWDKVRSDEGVRAEVNRWLGDSNRLQTRYDLRIRHLVSPERLYQTLSLGVDEIERLAKPITDSGTHDDGQQRARDPWDRDAYAKLLADRLGAYAEAHGDSELVLYDHHSRTEVSHRDVGIGISQVLPVLVNVYGVSNKIIAIEQPELHLHPRLQAELGDVFIESALGPRRNTLLLETHSEHLLLRIMRRMRETSRNQSAAGIPSVRPADVSVLYVDPAGSKSIIREMPLKDNGDLVKAWPGGFFEEGLNEVFS